MNGKELNKNLQTFLSHLDSINDTLPMTLLLLQPHQKKAVNKFQEFVKTNVKEIEDENGEKSVSMNYEELKIFEQLSKNSLISQLASKIIPQSLFVSLISQYDAFLNRLLKILFNIRPEYINNSERELTFSQLVEFDSIDSAREYIIEKEVECVLRKSHSEHFDYLEKKLGIPLRKNLPIWQTFIEITERRNLYVHCDGIVSSQYLKVCKDNKCNIDEIELNQILYVEPKYFEDAYKCLYELATKLTHTIWRKLIKEDMKDADRKLNDICYDLINTKDFELADILLDFACKQDYHFNDSSKNVFIVNKALSQYLQDKKENAKEIIESKDWSASSDDFKLAHLILTDSKEDSYELMKKIGKNGEVDKENYKTWPLFSHLRKEEKFKDTFKEVFGEEYSVLENPKRPIQEIIEDFIEKNPELKEKTVKKELQSKQEAEIEKK
jgi:hypothetical protein